MPSAAVSRQSAKSNTIRRASVARVSDGGVSAGRDEPGEGSKALSRAAHQPVPAINNTPIATRVFLDTQTFAPSMSIPPETRRRSRGG